MASSPAASSARHRSPGSSAASLRRAEEQATTATTATTANKTPPVETLVTHLLAAKRSLASMNHVLRANELATAARAAQEETVLLGAQAGFLRGATLDQAAILVRVRRSLQATYDWGRRDFRDLVKAMDAVDADLARTIHLLRATKVSRLLRPDDDDAKNLLDFVDEESVTRMREAMKKSIQEFQGIQQSFDGDLARFDNDIRDLKKIIIESQTHESEDEEQAAQASAADRMLRLLENSTVMAQLLASLTNHFDMCVTAIRTTEGGADLARRRAAETNQTQSNDGVSISGVIAAQESNTDDLEQPTTDGDRAAMLRVVVQDAGEVASVVREMHDRLADAERDHAAVASRLAAVESSHRDMLRAFAVLAAVADRLHVYLAAGHDFRARWRLERAAVDDRLAESRQLRAFYDGYAAAYQTLLLEAERRAAVDDRVRAVWRAARASVDKLLADDLAARDAFRYDVGEFLPTDLWPGMQTLPQRWRVVPVADDDDAGPPDEQVAHEESEAETR